MAFKIIRENKKASYIIIPEGLEKDGLYWLPPITFETKKRNYMLKNQFQLPDKTLWSSRPCVVIKRRIDTYENAEEQIKLLLQEKSNSNTSREKEDVIILRSDESCDEDSVNLLGQRLLYHPMPPTSSSSPEQNSDFSNDKSKILSKILKMQQKQLNDIQKGINEQLTSINKKLDKLIQIQYSNSFYPDKFCMESFKTISTFEEAKALEKMLMISVFKEDMVKKMTKVIIGSKGTRIGEGWDCCKDLVKRVFKRKFLRNFSRSGTSATQIEDAHIELFKYKNIISFFASVILNADPGFTAENTTNFFKKILRTSSEFIGSSSEDQNLIHNPMKNRNENQDQKSMKSNKRKRMEDHEKQIQLSEQEEEEMATSSHCLPNN